MPEIDKQLKIAASYAINTAVTRSRKKPFSPSNWELNLCKACLTGIGKFDQAEYVYDYHIANNTGINTIVGLSNGSAFETIENQIQTDYFSSYSTTVKNAYSIFTTSVSLGSYVASLNRGDYTGILYDGYRYLNSVLGSGPTAGFFTDNQINTITGYNYSGVLSTIFTESPKSVKTDKIYFRYYDFTDSFGRDITLVKARDSAIQAYSVSGELSYSQKPWDSIPDCSYIEIPIFPTTDPTIRGRYFYTIPEQVPCIDKERKINPITGLDFYRKFNDGPYSSGYWSESFIADSFQSRDKNYVHLNSNRDNVLTLSSFDGIEMGGLCPVGTVSVDTPYGEILAPFNRERSQQPVGGYVIEQHVGNYLSGRMGYALSGYARSESPAPPSAYEVYSIRTGHTGLRFAPIKLKKEFWSGVMSQIQSNPILDEDRIYQSALNLCNGHILDFEGQNSGIAGPPQRSALSDFPYVCIEQNFQSETAQRYAGVKLRLAISATDVVEDSKSVFLGVLTGSSDEFSDSTYYQPDENNQATVPFSYSYTSNQINDSGVRDNLIKGYSLGIGNSLDGAVLIPYTIRNNGYIHSGYLFSGGRVPFTSGNELKLGNYVIVTGYAGMENKIWGEAAVGPGYGTYSTSGAIIGDPQVEDTMLLGWAHDDYGEIPISPMYAYDNSTGVLDEYIYSGFDSGLSLSIADRSVFPPVGPEDGFAKNLYSSGLLSSGWYPVVRRQKRENSFPRYFCGPFATAKKRFLYPHAQLMKSSPNYISSVGGLQDINNKGANIFVSRNGEDIPIGEYANSGLSASVGFPHRVIFDLRIREYAAREIYKRDIYDSAGNYTTYDEPGVDPNRITYSTINSDSPTNAVDENYGDYDDIGFGYTDLFVMPDSVKNPCVYNSPPNYVQGFLSNDIGIYSGGEAAIADWPMREAGAYITRWSHIIGYGMGGAIYETPRRNNAVGIFTRFSDRTIKITGYYCHPGYRLETSEYDAENVYAAFAPSRMFYEENNDGARVYGLAGSDPLYFKRVGNFTGVTANYWPDEALNGGTHPTGPSGIVGDSWLGFYSGMRIISGDEYGYGHYWVHDILEGRNRRRAPERDNLAVVTDIKPSGLGFYFAALKYFPGASNHRKTYEEFTSETGYFKTGFFLPTNGTFSLAGKSFSYTGGIDSGILYQKPSGPSWSGNPSVTGWQTGHSGSRIYWRQQSKIDLNISNVTWSGYGDIPYDVEHLVMPTGYCSINGVMNYEHLSEKPVYSEGIFLSDVTENDVVKANSFYPQYLSRVLREHGYSVTIPANTELQDAPSKQSELNVENARLITQSSFSPVNTVEKDYNKYVVGAISDYAYLNATVMPSYDEKPVADGKMMPNTTMLFSASQGQVFPDGTVNPNIVKKYEVTQQKQYYDAELTISTGDARFMESVAPVWFYDQPTDGALIPRGVTWTEYKKGLY